MKLAKFLWGILIPWWMVLLFLGCEERPPASGPKYKRAMELARSQEKVWLEAIKRFARDAGRFPSEREGLKILCYIDNPQENLWWRGPYESESILIDPWGRPYRYVFTATKIAVISNGPDRTYRTGDDIEESFPISYYPPENKSRR